MNIKLLYVKNTTNSIINVKVRQNKKARNLI